MRYSRFDEQTGLYDVFEDALRRPLNADLPVPRLPAIVNGIGVPSREAGRPLPGGAKYIGRSWHPVGVVVRSGAQGLGADLIERYTWRDLFIVGGASAGVYAIGRLLGAGRPGTQALVAGAVALVAVGASK